MNKVQFRKSEVVAYLEDLILQDIATQDEEDLYVNYKWSGKLDKTNYTYKEVLIDMKRLWNEKY
jgi:hypothetical protein